MLEYFLDDAMIEDLSGVSRTINRPVKHAGNPLHGNSSWTWDRDINYAAALLIAGVVTLWHVAVAADGTTRTCVATSDDGVSFTRPTVGAISYAGNSSNNIVADGTQIAGVHFDASLDPKYLGIGEKKAGTGSYGVYLWSSPDGLAWTALKTLHTSASDGNYKEGRALLRLPSGRWLAYYVHGGLGDRRQPGAFLSSTTDPAGAWVDLGVFLDSKSADAQRYHLAASAVGDSVIGLTPAFVRSTEKMPSVELLVSRDGLQWSSADRAWISVGNTNAWDDEMVIPAPGVIEVGDQWFVYYTGFGANHAAALPRSAYVGALTIPRGRIVSIGSTGVVRTRLLPGANNRLTVNCDASGGGSLRVELLDASNRVIPGYARGDCTPITTDAYDADVGWGAVGDLPAGHVKVAFILDNAALHSAAIGPVS